MLKLGSMRENSICFASFLTMILIVKNSAGTLGLGYNDHLRNCFQELCAIVSQKQLFPTWLQMEDLLSNMVHHGIFILSLL